MFTPDIIIGSDTFSRTVTRPTSSTYSDNNQSLSNPSTVTISHETAKNARVNSAVIFDDTETVTVGNFMTADNIRVLVKVSYNPLGGRPDLTEKVKAAINRSIAFMQVENNVIKLLNKES